MVQPYISESLMVLMACCGLLALAITVLFTPLAGSSARKRGAVAIPRGRDSHDQPVPRWGGLAIYLGFFVSVGAAVLLNVLLFRHRINDTSLIQGAGIVLGGAVVSLVGAIDDRCELSPVPRLTGQIAASGLAYAAGVRVDFLTLPFAGAINTHWLSAPITIFWMLLIMNAINWLDGLDGLAAGICAIIAVFLMVIALCSHQVCLALLCVALAGSTAGFLRYNYSPARIYMGGGAEFLGFVLAAVSIVGAFKQVTTEAIVLPLLVMAHPILDSVSVVLRRAASGERVYQADRRHFHHALVDMGLTKQQAVLVLYVITTCLCLFAWALFQHAPPRRLAPRPSAHLAPHHSVSPRPLPAQPRIPPHSALSVLPAAVHH